MKNVWIQHGKLGLGSPGIDGYDGYITISRVAVQRKTATSEAMGVRVTAYGPGRDPYVGGRPFVASEVVWCPERWDPRARNRIGTLGAIVSDPPETSKITGAIERMRAVIAATQTSEEASP